ncbi:TenA family protein [Campylobacter molothri]|uniref:TenA family protein n=1 Tax=Campylobacter molothri TaxID=1032242 RepID=UPI00301E3533|nr:TenA family protein [Campylobacter sp. W0067]MBZ7962351.1 TenA family protein [Campylobacter sp. W0049]MBZ7970029.1 TenA family protein [Campylobacter sp. RM3125]MBZ7971704.1 TenA family protein [Campylobacter sp. RM3124]
MLFQKLIKENLKIWNAYIQHNFVKQLENETLSKEQFLFYLKQDYIYLINYSKCYARLALNANTVEELRFAIKFQNYTLEGELELHKSILNLGIDINNFSEKDESLINIAYSRYILSVGEKGDFLDMLIALSACAIGYGYIGNAIYKNISQEKLQNHPYKEWILTYSSQEFQTTVKEFEDFVNSYSNQISEEKFKKLNSIFRNVVRLEIAFWEHSLTMQTNI